MIVCSLCGKQFKTRQKIDGKVRNLCNRKYCLKCSPFGKHNTINFLKTNKDYNVITHKKCGKCKELKKVEDFYVNSKKIQGYCKNCFNDSQKSKWTRRKIEMVKEKGGKCQVCGYNKNFAALVFHHKDPKIKEASWTRLKMMSHEKIKKELANCLLICHNCHNELHYPQANILN